MIVGVDQVLLDAVAPQVTAACEGSIYIYIYIYILYYSIV
jgi:hypothetical protein